VPTYEIAHAYDTVTLLRDGGAARIELNRPDVLNAWNRDFGRDLLDAITAASEDESVRAVELTGAGRAFSAGADLKAGFTPTADGHPDVESALNELYHPIILGLRRMPKPVLAAVNGPAVGIGCSLALASDLVVAKRSAYFLLAFVNIGLVPDGGSSVFVPARAGYARAMEMSLLGEKLPAERALEWGLINRVVDDEQFDGEVAALVDKLANGPTRSYAGTKRQINNRVYAGIEEQLNLEASIQQEQAETADFREGVASFIERRPAAFKGR
jgi:2-(1,2-epoxy-1,2-dihydrophenyl)acetyl-CoA isomerase